MSTLDGMVNLLLTGAGLCAGGAVVAYGYYRAGVHNVREAARREANQVHQVLRVDQ